MNVMFIGGGRRISLARRFINAGFDVFAYETDKNCPISKIANIVDGKNWFDKNIEKHILNMFSLYSIDLAIPLQDYATVILSRISNKTKTKIPTASENINNVCLNKKIFESKLKDFDFYPIITNDCEKVIIKPIFGFSSKGISIVKRSDFKDLDDNFIVQRFIDSGCEISVDAYFNKNSEMIDAVPRIRLEVQGGEVSKSITINENSFDINKITKMIGEMLGLVGPTCFQYVIDNNKAFIMEINARFGGGVILSLEAGFDIINLIKREYINNEIIKPKKYNWKVDLCMARYFSEYFYEKGIK